MSNTEINTQTQNAGGSSEESAQQDPFVLQIGNCFDKFADALGKHMNTLGNHISNNIIEAMHKTSENMVILLGLRPLKKKTITASVSA